LYPQNRPLGPVQYYRKQGKNSGKHQIPGKKEQAERKTAGAQHPGQVLHPHRGQKGRESGGGQAVAGRGQGPVRQVRIHHRQGGRRRRGAQEKRRPEEIQDSETG